MLKITNSGLGCELDLVNLPNCLIFETESLQSHEYFEFGCEENSVIPEILISKLVSNFWELSLLTLRSFGWDGIIEVVDLAFRSDSVDLISCRLLFVFLEIHLCGCLQSHKLQGFSVFIAKPEDAFVGHLCQRFSWSLCACVVYPATTFVAPNRVFGFINC